jgi:hypothetical protein
VKRRIVSILLLAAMVGLVPGTAHATKAVGGCPDSYDLTRANKNTKIADINGDGWVCVTPIPAYPPGSLNVIDNNV